MSTTTVETISCYCALCISRCGAIATTENGRLTALQPDPSHPTGRALCAKGRAAPELVYHPDRLLYPMKRTRPKSDPNPGWERISWDEALDTTAAQLNSIAARFGPESVVFSAVSPSTSAIADSLPWIHRLRHAFGSPNFCGAMELCGWGRFAASYTFGIPVGMPGTAMPELEHTGCMLFWGYNPSSARIAHSVSAGAAQKRGARLIVVDPREAGMANRADLWIRPRPGSDGALALGIAHVMIERGWFDREFVRHWTNGPLLVRSDSGRFLRWGDLEESAGVGNHVAWDERADSLVRYDADSRCYSREGVQPAIDGEFEVTTRDGVIRCRTAFVLVRQMCSRYAPQIVESITWVPADQVEEAAKLLWESRPVSYFAWAGVEQHTNSTQISRALGLLYTLTGNFGDKGGNVQFEAIPAGNITGSELMTAAQRSRTLGLRDRPLGPARLENATTEEVYHGVLDDDPYPVRAMVGFGANLLMAHADTLRGREALQALDFYVHADLFMNPTAAHADIILPVSTPFEREGLKIGFEMSAEAQSLIQLRRRVVLPEGESRSDTEIVFDLATRLGLGEHFWDGDIDSGYRAQLAPTGVTLEDLRENPAGICLPLETRYRTYEDRIGTGYRGFSTPTGKVEIFSEQFLDHGYSPLPEYEEPLISHVSRPDLASAFPLVLTCAHNIHFCETQHRGLPSLRKLSRDPEIELSPDAAAERGIVRGDWVTIETPHGTIRAKARLNESLDPCVVVGQHGWWQHCDAIGAPGYDPYSAAGSNLNLIVSNAEIDPVSGSVPHRSYVCDIRLAHGSDPC